MVTSESSASRKVDQSDYPIQYPIWTGLFFHLIMSIRILLLGGGGREHALVWKLARSPLVDHIYVCPGNAGTYQEPKTSNIIDIPLNDFLRLVDFALVHKVCHSFFQFDT